MATKSFSYDHPSYQAVYSAPVTAVAGASQLYPFVAFTNMLVRSITIKGITAGTSTGDVFTLTLRSAASGTLTNILGTYGSAAVNGTNFSGTSLLGTSSFITMAQGDCVAVAKGTDATAVYVVAFEYVIVPAATVTS